MDRLAKQGLLPNYDKIDLFTCKHCLASKSIKKLFGKWAKATFPLQLAHSKVCSSIDERARHKAYYFIIFIDDYTHFSIIYLITHKSKEISCFQSYMSLVKNQLYRKIKALRTDQGYEYLFD